MQYVPNTGTVRSTIGDKQSDHRRGKTDVGSKKFDSKRTKNEKLHFTNTLLAVIKQGLRSNTNIDRLALKTVEYREQNAKPCRATNLGHNTEKSHTRLYCCRRKCVIVPVCRRVDVVKEIEEIFFKYLAGMLNKGMWWPDGYRR